MYQTRLERGNVKRILIIILALCAAAAAQDVPKIAVCVTGLEDPNASKAMAARLLSALVNSGGYRAAERQDEFVNLMAAELRGGAIDIGKIREAGNRFDVSFICIADVTPALGSNLVTARILDVKTAGVVAMADTESPLKTLQDLSDASLWIVTAMLGSAATNPQETAPAPPAQYAAPAQPPPQAQEAMPASEPGEYQGVQLGEAGAQPETVASGPRNSAMGMPMRPIPGMANPAFLNEENYMSVRFAFANTLETFYRHEAGFAMPIDPYSAAGVAWMMRGGPSYEATDAEGDPIGRFKSVSHTFALTYANNVWSGLTVGSNLNIITQNIPEISGGFGGLRQTTDVDLGMDIGLSWELISDDMRWGHHLLGFSTDNVSDFLNLIFNKNALYAAMAIRLSLLSDFWENRIRYGADLALADIVMGKGGQIYGASESPWEFSQFLGFNALRMINVYALLGLSSVEGLDYYGLALGVNMARFLNGRNIEAMAQYISIASSKDAGTISFYARVQFGGYMEKSRK